MFKYLTDINYIEIVLLSLEVSLLAVIIACMISMPFAAFLVIKKFPGRQFIIVIINTLMGLPPVVVGLLLYLLLSANGSLASYKLLYTPSAMVIAQIIIITPIITALSKESLEVFYDDYKDYLASLRSSNIQKVKTILWEGRYSLLTNGLAGLGRAMSEVGALIIVLETSRGEFAFALNLGLTLLFISLLINVTVHARRESK